VISGPVSDWLQRRKPLVVAGYSIGALSKPVFALASTVPLVYAARLFDRVGKGIRGAPRDALVADLTPLALRGRAFGLRQSLDTVGAILGPLLAILLMHLSGSNYRLVFWCAALPGILAVGTLLFGVHEDGKSPGLRAPGRRIHWREVATFQSSFWWVAVGGAVFQFARFSEAFLILRAKDWGLALDLAPLCLVVMNLIYALSAYPAGHLSDRWGRERFLLAGLFTLCLADLALGLGNGLAVVFAGIGLWGLHLGLTQGILAALVADTCPAEKRGAAYGLFNLLSAVALFLASWLAGFLWDHAGAACTFLVGSGLALASFFVFLFAGRVGKEPGHPAR
jgi:MFS family permease